MKKYLLLLSCLFVSCVLLAQINIPVNGLVKETFNTIGSTAGATLPAAWKMSSAGTGAASGYTTGTNVTVTTQAASSGTPVTGGRYNWATTAGTDRAIGFMSDAGYADGNAVFADYKNTTGAVVSSVTLSFNIERYRINTGAATVSFFYSTNGSTWTAANGGDISGGVFVPGTSSYTFTSPQTVYKKLTISSLSIANNSDFYLRWVFTTGGTVSQGLALDDVVLFAQTATPVITGSLRDNLQVDNNSNGQADFGDQIRYTTVIRNTGSGDGTAVKLTNPTPANTTLNAGSVKTSALARDDNYSTPINTLLSGTTVLANDFGLPAPTVNAFGPVSDPTTTANGTNTAKSDNGGTVLMNTDGTFSYTPPAGFVGFDRFAYKATTGTAPDNAGFVTIAVGSSVITPGAAESYNVAGNISITTPTSGTGNLLFNDTGTGLAIASVNGSAVSVGTAITTTNGGTLTVNSNGSFTYNPAPGYEGPDNFTYTIDNGFSTPSAPVTVTLTVAGMIWFIDNNYAGTLSDGRLGSPFKTLAAFQALNNGTGNNPAVNDNIFLYSSVTDYTGGISLLNGQKLIGAGASASLATVSGVTIPLYSAALPVTAQTPPVIVNAAGNGVTMNSVGGTNTIRGFDIHNCSGNAVNGLTFGTLTVSEVSINTTGEGLSFSTGAVNGTFPTMTSTGGVNNMAFSSCTGNLVITAGTCSGATNTAFVLTTGTISLTTNQNITQATNFAMISVTGGHNTGTVTFQTGTLSATNGTGLQFDNADGTYNFNGTTTLNGGDAGIDILNGSAGTFNFGTGVAITNPSGTAFNIGGTANTAAVTCSGSITKNNAGSMVSITNHATGTVTFQTGTLSATTASTGNGLQFDNADGTYNFNGTTTLNGGSAEVNIINGSGGNFTFAAGTAITSPADTAFNILGGTAAVTYNGTITQASAFPAVAVSQGHAAGTVAFNGAINATNGSGLQFDNADGTYNFTGVVTLNGGDAGIDILNGSGGTFSFSNSASNISNPTNELIKVNASTANVTYSGAFTKTNNTATGIFVNGETGGIININGSGTKTITNTTGNAINLTTNTGATINFSGNNLLLTTTSGTGFNATGGGTVSVAGTGNTVTSTIGAAINIANTTIGSGNITFKSASSNGAANGIILNTTGNSGGLIITGNGNTTTGGDNSGGTIQNSTANGIALTNTLNPSFTNMNISTSTRSGVNGTGVTNFTFNYGKVSGNGAQNADANIAFNTTNFTGAQTQLGNNINGTLTITGNQLTNGFSAGLDIQCDNGTVSNATITGNVITNPGGGTAGLSFVGTGNATTCWNLTKATIATNTITGQGSGGIQVSIGNSNTTGPGATAGVAGSATNIISITGNTITSIDASGTQAITIANSGGNPGSRTQTNFDISNNGTVAVPIASSSIGTVLLIGNNGYATMTGICNNNVIAAVHTPNGGGGNGIAGGNGVVGAGSAWTPDLTLSVTNNKITGTDGNGILLVGRGTSGTLKLKISGNNVGMSVNAGGTARQGIRVDAGNASSTDDNVCLHILGNTSIGSNGAAGIGVRKQGTIATTNDFGIMGIPQSPPSNTDVTNYIIAQNPSGGGVDIINGSSYLQCSSAP